jgi:predicted Zn-dependent protease
MYISRKQRMKNRVINTVFSLITALGIYSYTASYTYSYTPHNLKSYDSTRVAAVLSKVTAISIPPDVKTITVRIVNDDSFNASASQPYGPESAVITVNTGALALLQNEDELAFVLAHEWSHIILGHTRIEGVYDESGIQSEMYADLMGQQLARLAGYDPSYGAETWKTLIKVYGDVGGDSHPKCSHRQAYLTVTRQPLNQLFDILYSSGKYISEHTTQQSVSIDGTRQN